MRLKRCQTAGLARLWRLSGGGVKDSKNIMGSVAIRFVIRLLATAKMNRLCLLGNEQQRLNICLLMGAIAEGLVFTPSAAAPGVPFSFLNVDHVGAKLRRDWFVGHEGASLCF